ncbi:MAG: 2-aminoadipate transaminase [Solirubrobacteraceae bacterium]|nr:2-aminoadipate transaminase [Solirubrobacteraceae bacterium]
MTAVPDPPELATRLRAVRSSPVRDILALTERPGIVSFAGGLPAPELFDAAGMRAAAAHVLADERAGRTLQYSTTEGDPELRALVAARLSTRGLPTRPDDLLICSGSQQALTLVATALLDPGDVVLVEEPSYLAALQAFGLAGARLVGVPCDDEGLHPDAVEDLARRLNAKALYVIPTFQNPTGRTLPLERRQALADVAARVGLWLVEDDPYSELRYRGEPLPALATLPGAEDRTLALSTLSKVLAPGLRIGWVRAPITIRPALTVAKQAADLHTSTLDQAAAAHWLGSRELDAHLVRPRDAYRERLDTLVAGLADALPEGSVHNEPEGGMFVWARLPAGFDAEALLPRAIDAGVAYVPGYPFYAGEPDRATLRLSFTAHPPDEIAEGLSRLRSALS